MPDAAAASRLRELCASIDELLAELSTAAEARHGVIAAVPADRRGSASNLAHYLAVRAHDLRPLQHHLADLSLSSLGRLEGNVQHTLLGVGHALRCLLGHHGALPTVALTPERAAAALALRAVELLGPAPAERATRIMVTLPSDASRDRQLLVDLLAAGTDLVRINLAHDDPATWSAMVDNVRAAQRATGRACRILADLPGPKLRTGPLPPGPAVLRLRPGRDEMGRVTRPALVVFADPQPPGGALPPGALPDGAPPGASLVPLTVPLAPFAEPGDALLGCDIRGRERHFRVVAVGPSHLVAELDRTAYLVPGLPVVLRRSGRDVAEAHLGALPQRPGAIPLQTGDLLELVDDLAPGRSAGVDELGRPVPARIGCTLPDVFQAARAGQPVRFDDGKFQGVVEGNDGRTVCVRITGAPPGGGDLRAEKGINLPDTELHTSALTDFDLGCLDWVAAHADLVGMSFVQRPGDVLRLQAELRRRDCPALGMVLKIETSQGFQNLPDLLFAGLQGPPLGVMVARGDLAVEVGYARLAEVQEEILWLCEAAHVPVVWATQVLDSMARSGAPSRAEVTDAAMGVRAECVMLNKGPHIVATARFLGDLLHRMQEHHRKKRSMLRRLRVAGHPLQPPLPEW
jgi:pyruvate kinase